MTTRVTEQVITMQPSHNNPMQPNHNNGEPKDSFIEKNMFNSGPQADKTLPNIHRPANVDLLREPMEVDEQPMSDDKPFSGSQPPASSSANSDSINLYATSESLLSRTPPPSTSQNFQTPFPSLNSTGTPFPHSTPPSAQNHPGNSNDSSNLSTGGSGSDKETDAANKPSQLATTTPLPNTPESVKAPRKRKNTEAKQATPKTPRTDRKMTDYCKAKPPVNNNHAAQSLLPHPLQQNGDNSTNDLHAPGTSQTRASETVECDCKVESTTGSASSFESYVAENQRLNRQLAKMKIELDAERSKTKSYKEVIKELLIQKTKADRDGARDDAVKKQLDIGQFKPMRSGEHFKEQWRNGRLFDELERRLQAVTVQKTDIEYTIQNLRKQKPKKTSKKSASNDSASSSNDSVLGRQNSAPTMDDVFLRPEPPRASKELTSQDVYEQEEILKLRREHNKKEEADLQAEREKLERARNLLIREMKRIQCEDQSRFKDYQVLNNGRYLLLSLLGKGGFSEVWRAYDLDENRYVACKIHHVNKDWKEDKKANYVKHAMREKDIHKSLHHPRIVRLFDVFSIDSDSFCTVLEYCDGNDLDFYLKQHKQIPEKEARSIVMQVVSALKYLSERPNPIIHYDLKPANILLQSGSAVGEIKITDFGLSKQIENADDGESIELTSQGAGTYWYLPPETFQHFGYGNAPKISSKVDVWSVGVILYQCLFGKRPFGNDRTQQQILEERTILGATQVDFPTNPKASTDAQDFIRACLQYKKEERADVNQLFQHKFLVGNAGLRLRHQKQCRQQRNDGEFMGDFL